MGPGWIAGSERGERLDGSLSQRPTHFCSKITLVLHHSTGALA